MAQPAQNVFHALDHALAAAVAAAGPSVVHVARGHGRAGTGIVWADDLVISSSFHTPDRTKVGVATAEGDPELRDAEVIGRDPGTDVALLRVAGGGLAPARFRALDSLAVGNLTLALGRPGRTVRASLRAIGVLGPSIRTPHGGTLDRYVESDRQIPRGFAGGPLIDADGAVIGMNTRTLLRGEDLAIPTATLTRVVAELAAHGQIRRGYLGVGVYPAQLSPALAQVAGRDRTNQSADEAAGATGGAAGAVGDSAGATGGAAGAVGDSAGAVGDSAGAVGDSAGAVGDSAGGAAGAGGTAGAVGGVGAVGGAAGAVGGTAGAVGGAAGAVRDTAGADGAVDKAAGLAPWIDRAALIANIEDGSPAATAGLIVGDLIIEVAGAPITGPDSLRLALGDRHGETVDVVVLRGGAKLTLSVVLESHR